MFYCEVNTHLVSEICQDNYETCKYFFTVYDDIAHFSKRFQPSGNELCLLRDFDVCPSGPAVRVGLGEGQTGQPFEPFEKYETPNKVDISWSIRKMYLCFVPNA